jgi:hypothetical protein
MRASRSAGVGGLERHRVDVAFCLPHAAGGLERADGVAQDGVDQPEARGHRGPVNQEGRVLDHDRGAIGPAAHDLEGGEGLAAEQFGHGVIVLARPLGPSGVGGAVQRQNSSVCRRRPKRPGELV